ncbi:phosphoglycerate dehydrogenase [Tessaracoccus sp. MC1627]|uniref:phosphoglycerate dehydrogenase n=1 Tax=Tessaracoccus sp. MC1627 TaxID=2760312 RepID=UPI0016025042|nr:phosphoglycerate dehydrogenase [Tessaracoccus sp. MC1627]
MAYRVQTLNAISAHGLAQLPPESYVVAADLPNPDALLVRSANLFSREIPASVIAVARAGAGTNNVPVADLSARGVPVFNTPGANANAVKELVLAGLLAGARNIVQSVEFSRSLTGTPEEVEDAVERGKKAFVGFELPGRVLGVIGLGAIGVQVANAAAALGMRVLGYDPQITVGHAWKLSATVEQATSLEEVLKRSDAVSLHIPLVAGTRGLLGADRLALMKPKALLLNFSRAAIVDEEAVVDALDRHKLRGYICDFPSPRLNGHPAVVATPHLGASTGEAEDNCAVMAAAQLRAFLENGDISNSVNFPDAVLARYERTRRLAIANANVPNMVGRISTLLADAGLNIADLLNKSRGELAYTLIDVEGTVPDTLAAEIGAIEGVLSVRVI